MNVLIIEDEKLAAGKLQDLLKSIDRSIEVMAILETVEDSINWFLTGQEPDLIFMDIQLDDGSCFEIFESVKIEKPVIFITAYDEYAIKAFKVNSIDYLLKPVNIASLETAIEKYKKIYQFSVPYSKLESIINRQPMNYKERFFIKVGQRYKSILTSDINCFYIRERCNFILTSTGQNYAIDYSLEQLEKRINPGLFFRINRNYIVNIRAIEDMISYSSNRMKLKIKQLNENEDTTVSRDRINAFKKWMAKEWYEKLKQNEKIK